MNNNHNMSQLHTLQTAFVRAPLGRYVITACDKGVHGISRKDDLDENVDPKKQDQESQKSKTGALSACVTWLETYFKNPKKAAGIDLPPVCYDAIGSTEFERLVWRTLKEKTDFGHTTTYGELAERVGHPRAARAVGTAMKKNPVCLLVPCHRVIRSDGTYGNYNGGGTDAKTWLLNHEKGAHAQ